MTEQPRVSCNLKSHLLGIIAQLHWQGLSPERIAKLLDISDEECNEYLHHVTAYESMFDDSEKLLLLADRIDAVANTLEIFAQKKKDSTEESSPKRTPPPSVNYPVNLTVTTRKPQFSRMRGPVPEFTEQDVSNAEVLDARRTLATYLEQIHTLEQELAKVAEEVKEVRDQFLKPLQERQRNLSLEQQEIAKQAYSLMISGREELAKSKFVVTLHKNNIVAATTIVEKREILPTAADVLKKILLYLEENHASVFEEVANLIEQLESAIQYIEETRGLLAIWPARASRALHALGESEGSLLERVFSSIVNLFKKIRSSGHKILSLGDRVMETKKMIDNLLSTVHHASIRSKIRNVMGR